MTNSNRVITIFSLGGSFAFASFERVGSPMITVSVPVGAANEYICLEAPTVDLDEIFFPAYIPKKPKKEINGCYL